MPRITYVSAEGSETEIDVAEGFTVMEGAIRNNIEGIDADCGGACACGTCRVTISTDWRARLDRPEEPEREMIVELGDAVEDGVRLSCQLRVTEAHDGLVVRMPSNQQWKE